MLVESNSKMISEYIYYKELERRLNGDKPSYAELLHTIEWRNFRQRILDRDQNKCQKCDATPTENINGKFYRNYTQDEIVQIKLLNDIKYELKEPDFIIDGSPIKLKCATKIGEQIEKPIYIHAHHSYYILANLPWEYDLNALITLCNYCHQELHSTVKIPCYADKSKNEELKLTVCPRCSGSGYFMEFKHVQNGICFECRGAKYVELIGLYK